MSHLKIISFDEKGGEVTLKPETLEDFFHLYFIIEKEDLVRAETKRKISLNKEIQRKPQTKIVSTTLSVKVETVEYHEYMKSLRIKGRVVEDPQNLGIKGAYHTLNLKLHKPLTLKKKKWFNYQIERLRKAEKETLEQPIIISVADMDQCNIGILTGKGINQVSTIYSHLSHNKMNKERVSEKRKYFSEIKKEIMKLMSSHDTEKVVVAGPGFVKEELTFYLKKEIKEVKVWVYSTTSATTAAFQEILKSNYLQKIFKEMKVFEENKEVQEFLKELVKGEGEVTYGLKQVTEAATLGAVKKLLVSETMFREGGFDFREEIETLIEKVEKKGGKVVIISEGHEASNYLKSLGGIAAFLRFPV